MADDRLHWNLYKNIERELISLSWVINVDDDQVKVYSMKIADLLVSTSVAIEALSKELFLKTNGQPMNPTSANPYFDSDCIRHLNDLWQIEKKELLISSSSFYLSEGKRTITPLADCSQKKHGEWKCAYQAVKHNRVVELRKGNLWNLINALGALFILNLYNMNVSIKMGNDPSIQRFGSSFGSEIFSVKVHAFSGISGDGRLSVGEDLEKCVYAIRVAPESKEKFAAVMSKIARSYLEAELSRIDLVNNRDALAHIGFDWSKLKPYVQANYSEFHAATSGMHYEAVLNTPENLGDVERK